MDAVDENVDTSFSAQENPPAQSSGKLNAENNTALDDPGITDFSISPLSPNQISKFGPRANE